jgi:hypothetical protein
MEIAVHCRTDLARTEWSTVRAVFVVYLTVIVGGIVFFAAVGLTHH